MSLTQSELLEEIKHQVKIAGGQKAFAEKHGISPQYVNDVIWGRRGINDRIARTVGYAQDAPMFSHWSELP